MNRISRLSPTGATASDPVKDQSYFLAAVPRAVLPSVLFPVGGLTKARIREVAHQAGLVTAAKRKSVGICFVGKRKFAPFLGASAASVAGGASVRMVS